MSPRGYRWQCVRSVRHVVRTFGPLLERRSELVTIRDVGADIGARAPATPVEVAAALEHLAVLARAGMRGRIWPGGREEARRMRSAIGIVILLAHAIRAVKTRDAESPPTDGDMAGSLRAVTDPVRPTLFN